VTWGVLEWVLKNIFFKQVTFKSRPTFHSTHFWASRGWARGMLECVLMNLPFKIRKYNIGLDFTWYPLIYIGREIRFIRMCSKDFKPYYIYWISFKLKMFFLIFSGKLFKVFLFFFIFFYFYFYFYFLKITNLYKVIYCFVIYSFTKI